MSPTGRDTEPTSFDDATAHETPLQSDWPDKAAGEPPQRPGPLRFLHELPVLVLIAFGLAMLIKTFLVQAFYIPSESMLPTLRIGDRVLVNKLIYRFREPRRGEIIVFVAEPDRTKRSALQKLGRGIVEGLGARGPIERDFIKRLIGLPGDTIEMKDGVVTITPKNGTPQRLPESYLNTPRALEEFGPYTIPPGRYFMMGDNRGASSDSRVHTFGGLCRAPPCGITEGRIVGKAFVKIWPPSRAGLHRRPNYGLAWPGLGSLLDRLTG